MASPESVETSEIKRRGRRRLIGAVTLVLLLVVFVPMLLDSEPRPARQEPSLTIPPRDSAPPLPAPPADRVAAKPQQTEASASASKAPAASATPGKAAADSSPSAGKAPAESSSSAGKAPAESAPSPGKAPAESAPSAAKAPAASSPSLGRGPGGGSPEPAKVVPVPAPSDSAPAEARKNGEPKKAAAAPKLEGFAVQVGAFRDEEKLRQARQKLGAAGVVHYTERLEAKGGPLTRLRAGPYPTREAAEAALARLRRVSVEGKVVPLS